MLDDEEMVCVINGNGKDGRGADILVDPNLNLPGSSFTVVLNTAQAATANFAGSHPTGSSLPVLRKPDGTAFIEIRDVPASEVIVLVNHAIPDTGAILS